jgi:mono/diheme cytochrome c family protein
MLLVIGPLALGLAVASCGDNGSTKAAGSDKGKQGATGEAASKPPLSLRHPTARVGDGGPIDFIAANCAKCHGPEATLHKPEALAKYAHDDAKLHAIITTMITAQAPHPPTGDDYETLVSYHRSVLMHEPYIVVTDAKMPAVKDGTITLEGEVSSNSEMTFTVKGETSKMVLDTWYWTAIVPADATEVTFTAVRNGVKTVLEYPEHTHSHDAPLTP